MEIVFSSGFPLNCIPLFCGMAVHVRRAFCRNTLSKPAFHSVKAAAGMTLDREGAKEMLNYLSEPLNDNKN